MREREREREGGEREREREREREGGEREREGEREGRGGKGASIMTRRCEQTESRGPLARGSGGDRERKGDAYKHKSAIKR